jgi:hypothetical protein
MGASPLLFKFRCGCIGFERPNQDGEHLIVEVCDGEDDTPGAERRKLMDPGDGVPLTSECEAAILKKMNRYMGLGASFLEIKRILGVPEQHWAARCRQPLDPRLLEFAVAECGSGCGEKLPLSQMRMGTRIHEGQKSVRPFCPDCYAFEAQEATSEERAAAEKALAEREKAAKD